MSVKGAGSIGVGQGLMALAEGMFQQQDHANRMAQIDYAAQRQHSLEMLRQQFGAQKQRAMWEREDALTQESRAYNAELLRDEREYQGKVRKEDHQNKKDIERIKLENRRDSGEKLFGTVSPNNFTPKSMNDFQRHYNETGEKDYSLLQIRPGLDAESKAEASRFRSASSAAIRDVNQLLSNEYWRDDNPGLADSAGIKPNDDPLQVREKLLDTFTRVYMREQPESGSDGGTSIDDWDSVKSDAESAIRSGAPRGKVIQRLREAGAPDSLIKYIQRLR